MRKRIAVITAQIDEYRQNEFLTRFSKRAYELDYDVCMFAMYQKFQTTDMRSAGDSNIYELIQYDMFDAILFMPDTVLVPGVSDRILQRMRERFHGPVLVFELDNPYYPTIKIDHYVPMRQIVDHMIEIHGYKDIAFIGGKKEHPHSVQRLQAFYDSMEEHGLAVRDEWVFHGNYWYDSGNAIARKILKLENRPRALICANDCMAIGAAAYLTEHGVRVPEDIAITGYESIDEGKTSPIPLTSVTLPFGTYGAYSMQWLHNALTGKPEPLLDKTAEIYMGGSCGCEAYDIIITKNLRDEWKTVHSDRSYSSDFNDITEDLLSQTDFANFYQTVMDYTYQIRPFKTFHICLIDNLMIADKYIGDGARHIGYPEQMYRVLRCQGNDENLNNVISNEDSFETKKMLPDLWEETPAPMVYVFNPIYFNDRCFGYSVVTYSGRHFHYDETFRVWMKSIMQGMEACFRQLGLQQLIEKMKADQIRDALTGLYNYQGFLQKAVPMYETCRKQQIAINILALDIQDLKSINSQFGRDIGDRAINLLARILQDSVSDQEIVCRMCNDEFLIMLIGSSAEWRTEDVINCVRTKLSNISVLGDRQFTVHVEYAVQTANYDRDGSLEYLINRVVNLKNRKKSDKRRNMLAMTNLSEDDIRRNQVVSKIIDDNLFEYHFQPLVRARDGSIFGYEVLMRSVDPYLLSPGQILEGAACLGRLYDIEKATFYNVLGLMEQYGDRVGNRKIFMNSLPAYQLTDEDMKRVEGLLSRFSRNIVIEITEESELSDAQLAQLKEQHSRIHLEMALDDYGSGYSNINNLLRYMPQYVKIDQMLISEIEKNPHKQHFVRSIVEFAHNNHISALAEGVRTSEELRAVINLGVDLIQGFYTAKPSEEPRVVLDKEVVSEILKYQQQRSEWNIGFMKI